MFSSNSPSVDGFVSIRPGGVLVDLGAQVLEVDVAARVGLDRVSS